MLAVAVPSVQWLAVHADAARGVARAGAFVLEPPPRTPAERAKTWDYLGIVDYRAGRWFAAASDFAHAAETGPSYRILLQGGRWRRPTRGTSRVPPRSTGGCSGSRPMRRWAGPGSRPDSAGR